MLNYDINGYGNTVLFGAPAGGADSAAHAHHARDVRGGIDRLPAVRRDAAGRRSPVRRAQDPDAVDGDPPGSGGASVVAAAARQGRRLRAGLRAADFGTIHTPGDVPEKLEASAMATAGRLAAALIRRVSGMR